MKVEFQDALLEYARKNLTSLPPLHAKLIERKESLFAGLTKGTRKVFREKLRELAMAQNGVFGNSFFELFGDEIGDRDNLLIDDIPLKLFSAIVEQKSINGLHWLKSTLGTHFKILDLYKDQEKVQFFRDRVTSELGKPAVETTSTTS